MNSTVTIIIIIAVFLFFSGIRIIRPTHRGLIERLGKYNRYANPGFHWIIPVIEKKKGCLNFETASFPGTRSRNRTGKGKLPLVFETSASTCSATRAKRVWVWVCK